jgi:hypothetical protein
MGASNPAPGMPAAAGTPPTLYSRLHSSALALVVANLVPLYGVLALGWKVAPIMVFYWAENVVVGLFNVLKMARAQGDVGNSRTTLNGRPVTMESRRGMILFFMVHYGFFTLGHGVFVMAVFSPGAGNALSQLALALLVLSASHGFSYRRNFIGRGEYLRVSFVTLFWQPYVRVVVMHITILAGGALAAGMGSPIGALLVLVGLKTAIDLGAHWLERRRFARKSHA